MHLLLKKLIKDIITWLLDLNVNIYISISNTAKKKLFNYIVKIIKYYQPIKPLKYIKSIFFWLIKLSLFIRLFINLNYIKSEIYSNYYNMSNKVNNKVFEANPNCIKNKNHNYYYNISNIMINKKILIIEDK